MKKITEYRLPCSLCKGKRKILIHNEEKNTNYIEACPVCENKGYLAILKVEIV